MKTLDYIHLDAVAAGKVVEALQQLLADYQVFYTNLRGFHWNIKGHGFFVLHSKFEDMYNDAAEKVDELAERIRDIRNTHFFPNEGLFFYSFHTTSILCDTNIRRKIHPSDKVSIYPCVFRYSMGVMPYLSLKMRW